VLLIAAAVLVVQVQIEAIMPSCSHRCRVPTCVCWPSALILGVTGWTGLARLLRAEALKLRELEFVQAARHSAWRYAHPVAPFAAQCHASGADHRGHRFSGLVLAEAVLSYVGVGVDPAMISFGNMINGARLELAREPGGVVATGRAFLFMFVLVLAANLFADQVRDALDPKSSQRK
jgi:peptide/nickel transport system permease protein